MLGGGAVMGSMVLVAGAPGSENRRFAAELRLMQGTRVLYVTGEDSQRPAQAARAASRRE